MLQPGGTASIHWPVSGREGSISESYKSSVGNSFSQLLDHRGGEARGKAGI